MKVVRVIKTFTFDSAHQLPNYNGKCSNLHGHTYKLEVGVEGLIGEDGLVVDFALLSKVVKEEIIENYDHKNLNNYFENPTAENMVVAFFDILKEKFAGLCLIRLWETPTSYVEFTG